MRKITEYKMHTPIEKPQPKPVSQITRILPFELAPLVIKYNKKFTNLPNCCKRFYKTNTSHLNINSKYIERQIYYSSYIPPRLIISHFFNLVTYEVIGAEYFDFKYLQNCNITKLKLIHVKTLKFSEPCMLIKKLVFKQTIFEDDVFIKLMSIPTLESVQFVNVVFESGNGKYPDYVFDILNKLDLKSIKIYVLNDENYISKIKVEKMESFVYVTPNMHFEYNKSQTHRNKLYIKNCANQLYNFDYSSIFKIEIYNQNNVDQLLNFMKIEKLQKLTISECLFDDTMLMEFLDKFDELEQLDLSQTHFSVNNIIFILKKFGKTLRILNLNNIQLTPNVMDQAKKYLLLCKLIYNDNRCIFIRND